MEELIVNIMKSYSNFTNLSDGDYAYMIEADDDNLQEIAKTIIANINIVIAQIEKDNEREIKDESNR